MRAPAKLLCIVVLLAAGHAANAASDEPLKRVGAITLFGIQDRCAIASDPGGKRLYFISTSGSFLAVIDAEHCKEAGRIDTGLGAPLGAAYAPDLQRLIVAGSGYVRLYDDNLDEAGDLRGRPSNEVRYDPKTQLAYVGYEDFLHTEIAVIDPKSAQKVAYIRLDGYPEGFQLETKGDRIFVNIPSMQQIAVIDRQKGTVVGIWPLQDPRWSFPQNYPMALDEEHHRLFVGCRRPAKLIVIDTDTGKIVSTVDCCADVGNVYYDAQRKRIYASGDEYVSVFKQADPNTYKIVGFVTTGTGAVTSLFVPSTRKFYVAVPERKLQESKVLVFDCGTDTAPTTAPAAEAGAGQ